ncbi:MAG TPA: hypothetical protein VFV93_17905 [Thermomicrobiales bacterium]|nr:hypothetical protein [Thermomicrobiales bacterium]
MAIGKLTRTTVLLLLLILTAAQTGCISDDQDSDNRDQAINEAQRAYAAKLAEGTDFSSGPCIAEEVIDDWSVDIAHDPRQAIDDDPANQCTAYRNGTTHHFVELDPEGNLIRAK